MSKGPKLYQVAGLALVVAGILMFSGIAFATHGTNNVQGHSDFATYTDVGGTTACTTCHARSGSTATAQTAADSSLQYTNDFHNTHLNSVYLTGIVKDCSYCHKSISVDDVISSTNNSSTNVGGWGASDLTVDGGSMQGDQSGAITAAETYSYNGVTNGIPLRKAVSSSICNRCHGKFTTAQHGGTDYTRTNRYGCTNCHKTGGTGRTAYSAHNTAGALAWIVTSYSNSRYFCWLCHGGKDKFQTPESNKFTNGGANPDTDWEQ